MTQHYSCREEIGVFASARLSSGRDPWNELLTVPLMLNWQWEGWLEPSDRSLAPS